MGYVFLTFHGFDKPACPREYPDEWGTIQPIAVHIMNLVGLAPNSMLAS